MTLDTVCIELTLRCPMRCIHCSACASPTRPEMVDDQALRAWLGCQPRLREIYLSGGEPFEHPALEVIAEAAVERADHVILYSSGATSNESSFRPLDQARLAGLASRGVARVDISLYSAEPDIHDGITATSGSLETALESCRRVRHAGLDLGVHFVALPGVEDRLLEIADVCRALGARRLHVLAATRQGRGVRLPSSGRSKRFLTDLALLSSRTSPYELLISSALRAELGLTARTTRDGWRTAFMDVGGRMHPGEGLRLPVWRAKSPMPPPEAQQRALST